jgi:uncharacterized protein (TIGR03437 family)
MKRLSLCVVACSIACAQPVVSSGGIVNAASYLPGIAQGAVFIVFGSGLGPAQLVQAGTFPLSSALGGTTVNVSQGPNTKPAPLVYSSDGQLAAILPSDIPVGLNTLTVTYNGQTSVTTQFQVVSAQFGVFTVNSRGNGPAVGLNYVSQTDQPLNGFAAAANPDQIVTIYGTGLGPIQGSDSAAAPVGNLDTPVDVLLGSQAAQILYKGRSSCCAGIDQIIFKVPKNIDGCYVPLTVRTNGVTPPQSATLSIAPAGTVCTEPGLLTTADLEKALTQGGLRIGSMLLTSYQYGDTQSIDYGVLSFSNVRYEDLAVTLQQLAAAPAGGCEAASYDSTTGTIVGNTGNLGSSFFDNYIFWYAGAPLEAGNAMNISGGGKSVQFQRVSPGFYANAFYDYTNPLSSFLSPGTYTLDSGSGGTDVPGFRANINIPTPLSFSFSGANSISRQSDYTISWTGGSPDQRILISGISYAQQGRIGGTFTCMQWGSAGKMVIPASILAVLPRSGTFATGDGGGFLYLYSFSPYQRSDVTGLDAFYAGYLKLSYQLAQFQ